MTFRGRIAGQRGDREFLVQTGDNTGRVVDLETRSIATVPDLRAALDGGGWEPASDPQGTDAALRLVAESEARWRDRIGPLAGIDLGVKPQPAPPKAGKD